MAYATLQAVRARAGALAGSWTDSSTPSSEDVETFLENVASEIDALLNARGLTPPTLGSPAADALVSVNADGALVLALEATFPESSGPSSAGKTIDGARTRYSAAQAALVAGTHPVVLLLEAANVQSRASSFWENEPFYGIFPFDPKLDPLAPDANPNTAPAVARGQSL